MSAALYWGEVRHVRLRPVRHQLRYSVFMLLLELDQLATITRRLRLFALDGRNLVALRQRDHGDGGPTPLRAQIAAQLMAAGFDWDGGPIRMLFMPRVLGFAFNPLTVYYCHRRDDSLAAVLYEVHNTFGERHSYLLPVEQRDAPVQQQIDKRFHVSPFLDMALRYRFTLAPPASMLRLAITCEDEAGPVLVTSFAAKRRACTDGALLKAVAAFPFLGLKVLGAIHFEAMQLWRKKLKVHPHPGPAAAAVTIGEWPRPDGHNPAAPHPGAGSCGWGPP